MLLAIAGIIYAVQHGLRQQALYEQEARNAYADYTKHARNEVKQACVGLTKPEKVVCYRKAATEYEQKENDNERDQADLVAQRTSALWTKIMGIAALIGMGLSAVGVALVWTTFRETKKGANAAIGAVEANKDANALSSEALELAKTASRLDLRPFLMFQEYNVNEAHQIWHNGERYDYAVAIVLTFKNSGKYPAARVGMDGSVASYTGEYQPILDLKFVHENGIIAPNGTFKTGPLAIPGKAGREFWEGKRCAIIGAKITYTSIFADDPSWTTEVYYRFKRNGTVKDADGIEYPRWEVIPAVQQSTMT